MPSVQTTNPMLEIVCQRTNGWCTDGFVLCQTNRKNIRFWSKSLTCLQKNKSVWTSTIGSFADGISRAKVSKLSLKQEAPSSGRGLTRCLKTIGCESRWASNQIWCLKTIGLNACQARGTDWSDALKPLVLIHAKRQVGSDALKPLVFMHAQLGARTDLMP